MTYGENTTHIIQEDLTEIFGKFNLVLKFREIYTNESGKQLEFPDVLYITTSDSKCGFITTNYTKPTATGSSFINGDSHHPEYVFRAVIQGEATRLRRLNECDELYHKSLDTLKQKCID